MSKTYTLAFTLPADEIEKEPRAYSVRATSDELKAVAERFGLLAAESLEADITVQAKGHDGNAGIFIAGEVRAKVIQKCIVSLDPVPETISTPLELLLVSPEVADKMDADENYLDADAPEYDALEGPDVAVGDIVAQTVAVSMNPYPRAENAVADTGNNAHVSIDAPEIERENPFSVLSGLKDKS